MSTYKHTTTAAGLLVKPAAALVLCILLAAAATAQKPTRKAAPNSILGVQIGMTAEQADEHLETKGRNTESEGEFEEGETKEVWTLNGTPYSQIVLKLDKNGRVGWISGFVRRGSEIAFNELGDLKKAARANNSQAIWNVPTADGGYRLVAKGLDGKATVVYLLSLSTPSIE